MQILKITIEGDYWDCQIYRGRLYLFDLEGISKVYNWNSIVESLVKEETEKLALTCAFTNGNYLYGYAQTIIFQDREFRNLLTKKFIKLSRRKLIITKQKLEKHLISEQTNPYKDIATDTEISSNKLFAITDEGLFTANVHNKALKFGISSKVDKIWDCKALSLKANKYAQIAISAGNEGLFQYDNKKNTSFTLQNKKIEDKLFQISENHSLFSNWSYLSIYSSSYNSDSYMSVFNWHKDFAAQYTREFDEIIHENSIFSNGTENSLSWGGKNKVYEFEDSLIQISEFNNHAKIEIGEKYFSKPKKILLNDIKEKPISGGVAFFGTIIEFNDSLLILKSDNTQYQINSEITRWRIYPRSRNYENHLHVILDDKIEIYSFNHDYFTNQDEKDFGITYSE